MTKTKSEGLAGFLAFKVDCMPSIDGEEFVFEKVTEPEFEKYETEYASQHFLAVQNMTMRCGKKRRAARAISHNKE